MASPFKFGDVVRWTEDLGPWPPEPLGRFMVLGRHDETGMRHRFVDVICLVAAPHTDWQVGQIMPVEHSQFLLDEAP